MRSLCKAVILTICFLIHSHTLIGANEDCKKIDCRLIINTYVNSNPWKKNLKESILALASQKNNENKTTPYDVVPSSQESYEYLIIGCMGLVVLLLVIFQYYRIHILKKVKRIQQNELAITQKYNNLINNMPVLYLLEEFEKDANGKIVETHCMDVNSHFEEQFYKRNQIIGKKRRTLSKILCKCLF